MSIRLVRSVRFAHGLRAIFAVAAITLASIASPQELGVSNQSHSTKITAAAVSYAARPLVFESNRGQADASVRFVAHSNGYSLMLTDSEAVLALRKGGKCPTLKRETGAKPLACAGTASAKTDIVRMKLAGGLAGAGTENAALRPSGEVELPGKVNYFIGNDPAKWHAGVPTYAKVRYSGIYPGVDLVFYGNQRQLEYDFVVAPDADPSRIALALAGAKSTSIDAATGDLVIAADEGELRLLKPVTYQFVNGKRVEIRSSFRLTTENEVGFVVGVHDRALPLVIDPMLTYSTYLGGSGNDYGSAIAVDASGSAYVTGETDSANFPTLDPLQPGNDSGASFVTKFTPDGSALVYSTYLGGTGGDSGAGIAVDADGNAYITGTTSSSDFPTKNPLQGALKGTPTVFVAKINPEGSALVFSTYLGGSGGDSAARIAVDPEGNVYVTGSTFSSDFPLQNPVQATNNCPGSCGGNAFVTEIDSAGSALVYSTYLGGSGDGQNADVVGGPFNGDSAGGIAVDAEGEAVVAGTTYSVDFPVSNALQPQNDAVVLTGAELLLLIGSNGFVTKYKAGGSGYVFSTYLGGGFSEGECLDSFVYGDTASAVALDAGGNVYVTGSTRGGNFPTENPIQSFLGTTYPFGVGVGVANSPNAFVTEYTSDGSAYLFSTFLGGEGGSNGCNTYGWLNELCGGNGLGVPWECRYTANYSGDAGTGIAVDAAGSIYVTGSTGSPDFPVVNPIGNGVTGSAFISKLHSGGPLIYSSLFGSWVSGVAVDSYRNAYIAGTTSGLPTTPGAFQTELGGGSDAYVAKITIKGTPQGIVFNPPELTFGVPKDLTHNAFATSGLPVQYIVVSPQGETDSGDGGQATMNGNIVTPTWSGGVTIEAYQPGNETYEGAATPLSINVNPERLTVAAEDASMVYGSAVPALNYFPITVQVNDGYVAITGAPSLTTVATSRSPVGIYPIQPSLGTLVAEYNFDEAPPLSDPNYAFAFKNATLTVKKAELTVTAGSSTIHQGQRIEPELTYSFAGFRNGDKASVVHGKPILSTKATIHSPPGRYEIVVTQGTLSAENYKFREVDGWITIEK
ncbi:MAG: SBBP repeat-containing protein [Terracidiphilus sp.]